MYTAAPIVHITLQYQATARGITALISRIVRLVMSDTDHLRFKHQPRTIANAPMSASFRFRPASSYLRRHLAAAPPGHLIHNTFLHPTNSTNSPTRNPRQKQHTASKSSKFMQRKQRHAKGNFAPEHFVSSRMLSPVSDATSQGFYHCTNPAMTESHTKPFLLAQFQLSNIDGPTLK